MISGQSYNVTYNNLTANLKIFCKLGSCYWKIWFTTGHSCLCL